MSACDPLATLWAALDRAGCGPRGPLHKFSARCPAHDDRNPSLRVGIGADDRALVLCHAGCETRRVLDALGLEWCDLFAAGHHQARRRALPRATRADFAGLQLPADLLYAHAQLGLSDWRVELRGCASCGSADAALILTGSDRKPWLHCPSGCTYDQHAQVLAGRLADMQEDR